MKCKVCGKGPADGTTVYRQNPKGEPGIFACAEHDKKNDIELHETVAAIENTLNNPTKH